VAGCPRSTEALPLVRRWFLVLFEVYDKPPTVHHIHDSSRGLDPAQVLWLVSAAKRAVRLHTAGEVWYLRLPSYLCQRFWTPWCKARKYKHFVTVRSCASTKLFLNLEFQFYLNNVTDLQQLTSQSSTICRTTYRELEIVDYCDVTSSCMEAKLLQNI